MVHAMRYIQHWAYYAHSLLLSTYKPDTTYTPSYTHSQLLSTLSYCCKVHAPDWQIDIPHRWHSYSIVYVLCTCLSLVSVSVQSSAACPPVLRGLPHPLVVLAVPAMPGLSAGPPYSYVSPSPLGIWPGLSYAEEQPPRMPFEKPIYRVTVYDHMTDDPVMNYACDWQGHYVNVSQYHIHLCMAVQLYVRMYTNHLFLCIFNFIFHFFL